MSDSLTSALHPVTPADLTPGGIPTLKTCIIAHKRKTRNILCDQVQLHHTRDTSSSSVSAWDVPHCQLSLRDFSKPNFKLQSKKASIKKLTCPPDNHVSTFDLSRWILACLGHTDWLYFEPCIVLPKPLINRCFYKQTDPDLGTYQCLLETNWLTQACGELHV